MKRAFYFGSLGYGHFLHDDTGRSRLKPKVLDVNFPWEMELLDTGLLKNGKVPDWPDGRVFWTCGKDAQAHLWFAFFWWDRSGDKRPGSNSGFYVNGFNFNERNEAFEFACKEWPSVIKRQEFPLMLQP
jgi:hypothetical protein